MSLADVARPSSEDVKKYYQNRYQVVLGRQITKGLSGSVIELVSFVISCLVPIDDKDALTHFRRSKNQAN